ncbi:hypothetical protein PILCRDRAFT_827175 [Piloderma croceum F 1598]|uniref:Uncharacterized protein n=1 Tax=Piloderma croceum (strain F 1598) TaxID=765440 RepID=A0A0C3BDT9_PILCF|nr:hypothetical protein PILCRDRAFT_827175 [Piloderma croceum F 1598]
MFAPSQVFLSRGRQRSGRSTDYLMIKKEDDLEVQQCLRLNGMVDWPLVSSSLSWRIYRCSSDLTMYYYVPKPRTM